MLYSGGNIPEKYNFESWGLEAERGHKEHLKSLTNNNFHFVSKFKLLLAPEDYIISLQSNFGYLNPVEKTFFKCLPDGMDIEKPITDYLHELGHFALEELRLRFGSHVEMSDIQWGITVPALWDERAKGIMRNCMANAGLVRKLESKTSNKYSKNYYSKGGILAVQESGSPFPLEIILEPEAAAMCCFFKPSLRIKNGDKILLVDAGGGTVDLVVQQKIGSTNEFKVRQVSETSGGLCGSTFVDEAFLKYIRKKN